MHKPFSALVVALFVLALVRSAAGAPSHDETATYANGTYQPYNQTTQQTDPRLSATTQQICTPAGHGVVIHTLTAAPGYLWAVDLRWTDRYTDVGVLRGPGTIKGGILSWTPTASRPVTIVSLSSGRCHLIFPIVFLTLAPPPAQHLPLVMAPAYPGPKRR